MSEQTTDAVRDATTLAEWAEAMCEHLAAHPEHDLSAEDVVGNALARARADAATGCCDLCSGRGGNCWQCRGTGHSHARDPGCNTPAEECSWCHVAVAEKRQFDCRNPLHVGPPYPPEQPEAGDPR